MFRIRRIFWKIFLTYWLASFGILLLSTLVLFGTIESAHLKERHQHHISEVVGSLIKEHEVNPEFDRKRRRELVKRYPGLRHFMRKWEVDVYDEHNELLFGTGVRRKKHETPLSFSITGDSGRTYRVEALIKRPPRMLYETLHRFNIVLCIFLLVVSALVSLFLSWSITRPLKQLGSSSRRFAQGGKEEKLDDALLKRGDEIGDLARDIDYMNREVSKQMQSQRDLLHDVSHELRAPLARLQVVAGLLQQQHENDQSVARIHQECEKVDGLIQGILDFSRLDAFESKSAEMDLNTLIKEQLDEISVEYSGRVIRFDPCEPTILLKGAPELLQRALGNVLRNACKYTPEQEPIDINILRDEETVCLQIRDYGEGVKSAELEILVKPFYRGGNKMHAEGHGLGLSIAKRALDKLGGSLRVENHRDGGLLVQFIFPEEVCVNNSASME